MQQKICGLENVCIEKFLDANHIPPQTPFINRDGQKKKVLLTSQLHTNKNTKERKKKCIFSTEILVHKQKLTQIFKNVHFTDILKPYVQSSPHITNALMQAHRLTNGRLHMPLCL
jgi:hypothetical protein